MVVVFHALREFSNNGPEQCCMQQRSREPLSSPSWLRNYTGRSCLNRHLVCSILTPFTRIPLLTQTGSQPLARNSTQKWDPVGDPFSDFLKERPDENAENCSPALATEGNCVPLSKPKCEPSLSYVSFFRDKLCTFIPHCLQCCFILPR